MCKDCEVERPGFKFRTINVIDRSCLEIKDKKEKSKRIAVITVATQPINEEKTEFCMAASFCSPLDIETYSRNFGISVAFNRLMKGLYCPDQKRKSNTIIKKTEDKKLIDVVRDGCFEIAEKMDIKWMKKIDPEQLK